MFEFDEKLMSFKNLTSEQKQELKKEIIDIVVNGKVNIESIFFKSWAKHFGYLEENPIMGENYNNTRATLLISTAYPQRALLSFISEEVN